MGSDSTIDKVPRTDKFITKKTLDNLMVHPESHESIQAAVCVPLQDMDHLSISIPQFGELEVGLFVVIKECLLICSIFLHKRAEDRVAQQGFVTWELKKALLVATQKFLEVRVVKDQRVRSPGPLKTRPLFVAPSQGVATREGNNVLITQTHLLAKDLPQVVRTLGGIRKTALRWRLRLVLPAGVEGDLRPTGDLDGHNSGKLVEIGIGEGGELLLDGLEQPHRDVQPRVGAVSQFRRALHSTEGTAGPRRHVERPRGVPREAEHEGRAALLGDEGAELAPGLLDGLAVLGAHGWVVLRHGPLRAESFES